jgi:hypothetical protein
MSSFKEPTGNSQITTERSGWNAGNISRKYSITSVLYICSLQGPVKTAATAQQQANQVIPPVFPNIGRLIYNLAILVDNISGQISAQISIWR